MDYEILYKNALERAKKFIEENPLVQNLNTWIKETFPELKEPEDEKVRKALIEMVHDTTGDELWVDYNVHKEEVLAWLEKQGEQKPAIEMKSAEESLGIDSDTYNEIVDECIYGEQKSQRMISAEAKEAIYNKSTDKVEPKCEESKTKVFDAPTPFEDKLYAFVLACEILVDPSKREFILEHSQEILDAARKQIGKEQSSTWSKEDEKMVDNILTPLATRYPFDIYQPMYNWLKSLKQRIGGLTDFDVIGEVVQRNLLEEVVKQMSDTLLVETLLYRKKQGTLSIFYNERKEGLERFLKSICTWKPSDEQMELLKDASARYEGLQSLYNDLNRLKG